MCLQKAGHDWATIRSCHFTSLHFTSLHFTSLHFTSLHFTSLPGRKQLCSDFMAAITICNDSGAQEEEIYYYFHIFPIYHEVMEPDAMILVFLIFNFKLALSLSSFTLNKRLFSSYSLSAIRVVSSTFLRLLMLLPPILIPACSSSSLAFLMMC